MLVLGSFLLLFLPVGDYRLQLGLVLPSFLDPTGEGVIGELLFGVNSRQINLSSLLRGQIGEVLESLRVVDDSFDLLFLFDEGLGSIRGLFFKILL